MIKQIFSLVIGFLCCCVCTHPVEGHDLFISAKTSMSHPPGHITLMIGYGHAMPMDEFIDGQRLTTYALYNPDLKKMELPFNRSANKLVDQGKSENSLPFAGLTVQPGDVFAQMIQFADNTPKGTYQAGAAIKTVFFSMWKDDKGKVHKARKALDEIKNAKEIMVSVQYQAFAKTCFTMGHWSAPKPLGYDLEIVPLGDLTSIKIGDIVEFQVLYLGKPIKSPVEDPLILKAYCDTYGNAHSFGLYGVIDTGGKASIKITRPGQWLVSSEYFQSAQKKNMSASLRKKCLKSYRRCTLSFDAME
jgi:uncharacterized GH25 family protein